jgi:hypothetical protein
MLVSKIREDGVFDGTIEVSDDTTKLPPGYSFSVPKNIPNGYYAIMQNGWVFVKGEKPVWPSPVPQEYLDRELYNAIVLSTQQRLDTFAQSRDYANILSACTYATSTVEKFRLEGEYCVQLRDQTWSKLYQMLDEVLAGIRPKPSGYSDIESELPPTIWPT